MRATAAFESRLFSTVESKRAKGLSLGIDDMGGSSGSSSLQKLKPKKL